jgi:RNAse (barnase) inhibitor barstar
MMPFLFGTSSYDTSQVFYARLGAEIHKSDQLLEALYYLLWFPGYFGFNWDALNDCLKDFSWITEKKIVLVHTRLPKVPETDLKIYLGMLHSAVLAWKPEDEHCFEVVFSECDRDKIAEVLTS